MKSFIFSFLLLSFATTGFAQDKSETIKVSGECGTCKKKIEGAAKKAGASFASWNADTKELNIKYKSSSSNTAKIEQAIAKAGYDTEHVKATEEAYNKLDDCCKYERTSSSANEAKAVCDNAQCAEKQCMKDGKCTKDMSCCKDSGCDKNDCCKH